MDSHCCKQEKQVGDRPRDHRCMAQTSPRSLQAADNICECVCVGGGGERERVKNMLWWVSFTHLMYMNPKALM